MKVHILFILLKKLVPYLNKMLEYGKKFVCFLGTFGIGQSSFVQCQISRNLNNLIGHKFFLDTFALPHEGKYNI
jgi:hypothetical protein